MSTEKTGPKSGWSSSKLHLALITMAVITGVYLGCGISDVFFGEFVMGILGAAGIYSSSRVAESFAQRRPPGSSPP